MQIKKRLQINIVVSVLTAFFMYLVLFLSLVNLNKANNKAIIAGDLMTSVLERVTLRNDYMRNNSARAKEQWFAKHEHIGGILKAALDDFRETEDRKIISEMIENHESIGKIFSVIVTNRQKDGLNAGSAGLSRQVEERLLSQLNMRVYEEAVNGRKLRESNIKARASALRLAGGGIISVLAILVVAAMINSWTLGRAITERAALLRDGAVLIGGGALNHRIDIKGDDEFAELAGAFNAMTAKLSGSYHELENEIEERKRAEEALRETGDYLDNLFNYANAPVIVWDSSFCVTRFNHAFERLTGLKANEVIGKTLDILFPDNSKHESMELIEKALSGERWETVEIPILHTDGTVRIVLWNSANIQHRDNTNVVATIAQGQDITERKRAEEALRAREADLREAQRLSLIGSWYWDATTGVTTGSDELLRIFGFDPVTQRMPDFKEQRGLCYPVEDWERVNSAVQVALETGVGYELDVRVIRNGMTIWVTTRSEVAWDANNRIAGLRGTVQDITERKQAEERLRASLLEKEVMLKEIHHRVKNNLQVISSLVGLQADGSKDETVREVLKDVTYRVRSMALVHEKLYQSNDLAHIDFSEYTRGLLSYLWRAHGEAAADVRLVLNLEPVLLPVDTAVPCGLILNELVGNALKHAFHGRSEGEVTVSLQNSVDGCIHLSVADNGVGLPEEFDWRETRSLGLRLVQMLSGQLDAAVVVSGEDGTRFEIVI